MTSEEIVNFKKSIQATGTCRQTVRAVLSRFCSNDVVEAAVPNKLTTAEDNLENVGSIYNLDLLDEHLKKVPKHKIDEAVAHETLS